MIEQQRFRHFVWVEPGESLSIYERVLLWRLSCGLVPKQVAVEMDYSLWTIRMALTAIRKKLGAKNTVGAVAIALRSGLIP